jgi:hypothetical protein
MITPACADLAMATPPNKKATRKQRLKVVATDFQASAEEQASASRLQLKTDADLFVVDTVAAVRRKRKLEPKEKKNKLEATKLFKKAIKSQAFEVVRSIASMLLVLISNP